MANNEIRAALANNGMKYWELADELKITDGTLSKKLRHEFDEDEKKRILSIIKAHKTVKNTKKG